MKDICDRCNSKFPSSEEPTINRFMGMSANWDQHPEWNFDICPKCLKEVMTGKQNEDQKSKDHQIR